MTKTFDVIEVSPTLAVVVDKDAEIVAMKTLVFSELVPWHVSYSSCNLSKDKPFDETGKVNLFEGTHKVIATIGTRLEGIPLIQIEEEVEIKKLAEDFVNDEKWGYPQDEVGKWTFNLAVEYFIHGYKAAQKGVFTEEDIRKAFQAGRSGFASFTKLPDWKNADEYIKSLNKVKFPVRVELKLKCCLMYQVCVGCDIVDESSIETTSSKEGDIVHPVNVFYD